MKTRKKNSLRRVCGILLVFLLGILPLISLGEYEDNYDDEDEEPMEPPWIQLNQSVMKSADWQRVVADSSAFQLGETHPLEEDPEIGQIGWGTYPSLDGSTVCVPLAMELARQWLDLSDEDVNGFVNFSNIPYAYERLIQGKPNLGVTLISRMGMMDEEHPIDIVLGPAPDDNQLRAAEKAGVTLKMIPVCYDALVFMVNPANPVENLSGEEIRGIYTGAIKTWDKAGGESDSEIWSYQQPYGSGSQTAMEKLVMEGAAMKAAEPIGFNYGVDTATSQFGSYSSGYRDGIGFSCLYYANSQYQNGIVKLLAIDGVKPEPENLRTGAYRYALPYYAVYAENNENADRFVQWLISEEGQRCVAQAGYVRLSDAQK